jgi:hypothetical protein
MARVITFSTRFPSYHPRAGEPTLFIEKIYASLADTQPGFKIPNDTNKYWDWYEYYNCKDPKHHTIRAGHRFKAGDKFSPRVWSCRPYNSKQITFAPDIEVKKTWNFEVRGTSDQYFISVRLDGKLLYEVCNNQVFLGGQTLLRLISRNDGLVYDDFQDWFKFGGTTSFTGQIICWNENIEY